MNTTAVVGKKISQIKDVSGLLECTMNHTVAETTATFKWTAPKIPREEWNKVLAFFRWTYDEHKSESQVRLFVNPLTKEWKAWAFPQKARTGMTATELDTEETKTQRAQFKDSEGWQYFGTVHHHCSASAFQSGTDETNEKDQDGLHITVGKMDSDQYDIHYRVYLGGFKMLMAKLSDFWDVDQDISALPVKIQAMLKRNIELLACDQMGTPPPADQAFPDQWKSNVIEEVTTNHVTTIVGGMHSQHWSSQTYSAPRKFYRNRVGVVYDIDKTKAIRYMRAVIAAMPPNQALTLEECVINLSFFIEQADDDILELLDIMFVCDLTPESMMDAVKEYRESEKLAMKELGKQNGKRSKSPKTQVNPASEQQRLMDMQEGEGWQNYGHGM